MFEIIVGIVLLISATIAQFLVFIRLGAVLTEYMHITMGHYSALWLALIIEFGNIYTSLYTLYVIVQNKVIFNNEETEAMLGFITLSEVLTALMLLIMFAVFRNHTTTHFPMVSLVHSMTLFVIAITINKLAVKVLK